MQSISNQSKSLMPSDRVKDPQNANQMKIFVNKYQDVNKCQDTFPLIGQTGSGATFLNAIINKQSVNKCSDVNKCQDTFLLMGQAGSGKTTLLNAIMNKKYPQNMQRCCTTDKIIIQTSQDNRIKLVDTPDFTCSKGCFEKALNQNKEINLIKFKGIIMIVKFHPRIQNIIQTFRSFFTLDDLIRDDIQDKAILIISHMDQSKNSQYQKQTIEEFENIRFRNFKLFCSFLQPKNIMIQQLKDKIINHFKNQEARSLNLYSYKPDIKKIQSMAQAMRQYMKDQDKNKKIRQDYLSQIKIQEIEIQELKWLNNQFQYKIDNLKQEHKKQIQKVQQKKSKKIELKQQLRCFQEAFKLISKEVQNKFGFDQDNQQLIIGDEELTKQKIIQLAQDHFLDKYCKKKEATQQIKKFINKQIDYSSIKYVKTQKNFFQLCNLI